jgi:Na+/pantothenate symporter
MNDATSWIAVLTFVVYAVTVFVIGLLAERARSSSKSFLGEFFLGSRGLGTISFAMTFAATSASAGTFAGLPALCYLHGWCMLPFVGGIMVGTFLIVGGLGKRMNQVARRAQAVTLPDVLRERFGSRACGLFSTTIIAVMLTAYLVPQFKLGAMILDELIGESPLFRKLADPFGYLIYHWLPPGVGPDYVLCLILFTGTVLPYVTCGGFRAVVWTDVMQGFVMIFGIGTLFLLAFQQLGNPADATQQLAELKPPRLLQIVFQASADDSQRSRIPAGTWIELNEGQTRRLLRTNEDAYVEAGIPSVPIKSVEIITPAEIHRISTTLADQIVRSGEGVPVVEIVDAKTYARSETGAYLSLPGPDAQISAGFLPVMLVISYLLYYPVANMGQPGDLVRLMAFDSSRTLKRAIPLLASVTALIYLPILLMFVSSRLIAPGLDADPDRIMPTLVRQLCSGANMPWLTGLLFAAPFAAAMSTVDSFILIVTSSIVRDIYQREIQPQASERLLKRLSYSCTILVGLLATAVALNPPKLLLLLIVFVGSGLTATFAMPVAIALFWKRMNATGCLSGMFCGLTMHIGLHVPGLLRGEGIAPIRIFGIEPVIWAVVLSALASVCGSLLTRRPSAALVQKYFGLPPA